MGQRVGSSDGAVRLGRGPRRIRERGGRGRQAKKNIAADRALLEGPELLRREAFDDFAAGRILQRVTDMLGGRSSNDREADRALLEPVDTL